MDVRTLVAESPDFSQLDREALVVVVPPDRAQWQLDAALCALLDEAVAAGDLALKPGRTLYMHRPAGLKAARLAVAVAADGSARAWKKALAAGLGLIKGGGASRAALVWAGAGQPDAAMAEAAACVASDLVYVYRLTKPSAPEASRLGAVELVCAAAAEAEVSAGLARGAAIAAGVELAREVANRPANHCTPSHLADEARALAKMKGVKAEILERKEIEALGMGSFLAVAQGSAEPPRFIVLKYQGAGKKDAPVVLVGKGITFDTGGISIKPAADMDEMKFDMGGAASVLGTFRAVAALRPKVNLIGLIPTCENMPDGRAVKPGDVVTSMSGQTIEILNTDAEGRLILCDALTYAERFKPAAVVDIATLTGACIIALVITTPVSSARTTRWPTRCWPQAAPRRTPPGACRSTRSTTRRSRATSPTCPTSARVPADRSPQPSSCSASPRPTAGRIWTWRVSPSAAARPRAAPVARCRC